MPSWKPNTRHSITTRLVVSEPTSYIRFLREAFDADGDFVDDGPAELRIGDSMLMVSGKYWANPTGTTTTARLHLYVPSVDGTFRRALNAGAIPIEEPWNAPDGHRRAKFTDPRGNEWQLAMRR